NGVFQQILPVGADDELLAELHTFDRGRHQASSAKRNLYRVKTQTPERVIRASHPAMRASWDSEGAGACRSARRIASMKLERGLKARAKRRNSGAMSGP